MNVSIVLRSLSAGRAPVTTALLTLVAGALSIWLLWSAPAILLAQGRLGVNRCGELDGKKAIWKEWWSLPAGKAHRSRCR